MLKKAFERWFQNNIRHTRLAFLENNKDYTPKNMIPDISNSALFFTFYPAVGVEENL